MCKNNVLSSLRGALLRSNPVQTPQAHRACSCFLTHLIKVDCIHEEKNDLIPPE